MTKKRILLLTVVAAIVFAASFGMSACKKNVETNGMMLPIPLALWSLMVAILMLSFTTPTSIWKVNPAEFLPANGLVTTTSTRFISGAVTTRKIGIIWEVAPSTNRYKS